jgi:hypothetical protein
VASEPPLHFELELALQTSDPLVIIHLASFSPVALFLSAIYHRWAFSPLPFSIIFVLDIMNDDTTQNQSGQDPLLHSFQTWNSTLDHVATSTVGRWKNKQSLHPLSKSTSREPCTPHPSFFVEMQTKCRSARDTSSYGQKQGTLAIVIGRSRKEKNKQQAVTKDQYPRKLDVWYIELATRCKVKKRLKHI